MLSQHNLLFLSDSSQEKLPHVYKMIIAAQFIIVKMFVWPKFPIINMIDKNHGIFAQ